MALSSAKWLERYRARIVFHQPGISSELLDDYATMETYLVMSPDFPDDPEFAVDIDPDLAYVERPAPKKSASPLQPRRYCDDSNRED